MTTIFAIPMRAENQQAPLNAHCFGDCGKVSMGGAIVIDQLGPCWVCPEKECPYEREHVGPVGTSSVTGDEVYVRSLNDETDGQEEDAVCIGCGCTESHACFDEQHQRPCHWVRFDREAKRGVCSACPAYVSRWDEWNKEGKVSGQ